MNGIFHEAGFWVAVSFVLFFVFFGRKLWTPIVTILDSRAERIRQDLDEAARLRREAEQMLEDATRDREQALAEAKTMVEQSLRHAAEVAEQARKDAEAAVKQHEQSARDRISAVERAATREVRQAAIDVAIKASRQVVAESLKEDGASALVDRAISDLPAALARPAA